MNLFRLFHKKDPKDAYEQIVQGIVTDSLLYRTLVETQNNRYSANAGAEMLYFLLHMFDRQLLEEVGSEVRDRVFDKIAIKVLGDYVVTALKPETPAEMALQVSKSMFEALNERQRVYSKCKCLMVKGGLGAAKGSIVFALSFYIHKALGKTDRNNVDEILWGEKDIVNSELDDFPGVRETVKTSIYAMNTVIENTKMWRELIKAIAYD